MFGIRHLYTHIQNQYAAKITKIEVMLKKNKIYILKFIFTSNKLPI